jgi:DNA-directed RNA polymerase specialized sigma24 family protein
LRDLRTVEGPCYRLLTRPVHMASNIESSGDIEVSCSTSAGNARPGVHLEDAPRRELAQTSFVPKAFQGKPAEVTAAIMAGQEIGLQPVAALRSIDVIQGKPSLSAVAMRGLVQSKGHEVWVEESTETRAIVKGRRRGEEVVQTSTWTIDRAKRMGLTSKSTWKDQPQAMLIARATAECCRLVAADVILGMPYAREELLDLDDEVELKPARKVAKRRTVKRAELTAEPELSYDDIGSRLGICPNSVGQLRTRCLRRLRRLLASAGITDAGG